MRFRVGRARLMARGLIDRVAERVGRRVAVRMAGAAVAAGGLALMGFGTIGSPLSAGVLASPPSSNQAITSISEACSGGVTTGTLTVDNAIAGDTVILEVFAHQPGNGPWLPTGATEIITMVAGTSDYSYSISGVPASFADGTVSGDDGNDSADPDSAGDDFNAWRVQVSGVTGIFDGTTTKSASFECSAATTTTTSSTTTSSTTTSSTSSTSSSSSSTSSTSSSSSSRTTSSQTAPASSTTSSSVSSSTAPASTSTTSISTGVGAATTTPSTGADAEFGFGLGLMIAGAGVVAGAARIGRRPKK